MSYNQAVVAKESELESFWMTVTLFTILYIVKYVLTFTHKS